MRYATRMKNAVQKTDGHIAGVFDEARHRLTDLSAGAQSQGERLVGQLKERGVALIDEAQSQGESAVKFSRAWISHNPGRAVGAAFVLGAIASAFFRRRKE
jgi:ElaB/YqjD/DUF883 family membrane-anchored ribosome-binding protein